MNPARQALRDALTGTSFEGRIFLVGGWVRDRLLGLPSEGDLDLVVEGDAGEAAELLWQKGIASAPPQIFARFGTASLLVEGQMIELASSRAESYRADSRKPSTLAAPLAEDAFRRDFTANALMEDLWTGEVKDFTGLGLSDLQNRILRTPRDPAATFWDDPLRILRAVRFASRLEFDLAPGLPEAIREQGARLEIVSGERIREELNKMLLHPSGPAAFQLLADLGLLPHFAPELEAMRGVDQGRHHHLDVWGHSLLVVHHVGTGDLVLSWAALLHDLGKPSTKMVDEEGETRFFGHAQVGAEMAAPLLERLRFSRKEIESICLLTLHHMRLGSFEVITAPASRRLIRDLGPELPRLFRLVKADTLSLRPGCEVMDVDAIERAVAELAQREEPRQWKSPLSGRDIMALVPVEPGPLLGELKEALREAVMEGKLGAEDRMGAEDLLKRLFSNRSERPS